MMKRPPLPSYQDYKNTFLGRGVSIPLKQVVTEKKGLLSLLPKAQNVGWPWIEEVSTEAYDSQIDWPKISVISPSYNQGKYFEETIRSVLLQNYPNLEYIIMDGGSNDETLDILEKYSPWVSYWKSEKDRGQSHAINKGFSLASGKIYCWINSDDYFTKGALKEAAMAFLKTRAQFLYGNCANLKDGKFWTHYVPIVFDRYLYMPGLAQPSIFWDSDIHQPVWEELNCTLDFELWMRIAKGSRKKYIDKVLSVAREHSEAKTHTKDEKLRIRWQEDQDRQWQIHGPIPWERLNKESRIVRRVFKTLPFLKKFF